MVKKALPWGIPKPRMPRIDGSISPNKDDGQSHPIPIDTNIIEKGISTYKSNH
jgi:hypothetical protein